MLSPAPQSTPHGNSAHPRQLAVFFVLAFVIAWAVWIPLLTTSWLPRQIAFLGLFAPAIAALLTAAFFEGSGSLRRLLQRLFAVHFPWRWAALSAAIMPAIYFVAISLVRVLQRGKTEPLFAKNSPLFILTAFVWLVFVTSGEELGWRGYALPRLLATTPRILPVSLGLGLVWGAWHLPLYLIPGQSAFPIPLFLVFTTILSVLYSLMFLRTGGSLIPALLLHAGTDVAPRIFQLGNLPWTFWLVVDLCLAVVVATLCITMRRQLASGAPTPTEDRPPPQL